MIYIYVDGSFKSSNPFAGWGYVIIEGDRILHQGYGKTIEPALSRNIDGELFATIRGLSAARSLGLKEVTVAFDYWGIQKWASGEWNANSVIAKWYKRKLSNYNGITIHWLKVKGHSGNQWNDYADKLASKELK